MPHQSSHVRSVPKRRKSDIVDLLLKKAYVSSRRASHSDGHATRPAASGSMTLHDVGTNLALARPAPNNLASSPMGNDRQDDMIATVKDNKTEHRFELEVEGHLAAAYYRRSGNAITFEHT